MQKLRGRSCVLRDRDSAGLLSPRFDVVGLSSGASVDPQRTGAHTVESHRLVRTSARMVSAMGGSNARILEH